jgi:hypothetical protein
VRSGFEVVGFVPPIFAGKVMTVITFVSPAFARVG